MRPRLITPFHLTLAMSAMVAIVLMSPLTPSAARPWALVALAGLAMTLIAGGVLCLRWRFFGPAITHGPRDSQPPAVALTFDDGPDPHATAALLDLLEQHHVKATFFCIGQRVLQHPELARRLVAQGHLIANHSHTHRHSLNLSLQRGWQREIHAAQEAIRHVTGQQPTHFRPPLGMTNPHLARPLHTANLKLVGWDVRSFDTLGRPVHKVVARVMRQVRPGSVILLHDGGQARRASADRVTAITRQLIEQLTAQGYRCVRLDTLLGNPTGNPDIS